MIPKEQAELKRRLGAAYKKTPDIAHQKALARASMELESHLHHTMRELDLKKEELKKVHHEVNCLKERLKKRFRRVLLFQRVKYFF